MAKYRLNAPAFVRAKGGKAEQRFKTGAEIEVDDDLVPALGWTPLDDAAIEAHTNRHPNINVRRHGRAAAQSGNR
jgi:hypothetical protein